MKLNKIFENFPQPIDNEKIIDTIISPAHEISDDTMVSLIKDANVLLSNTWGKVHDFLTTNFDQLSGNFKIINKDGIELHSFDISN